jgi:hypothetical protein
VRRCCPHGVRFADWPRNVPQTAPAPLVGKQQAQKATAFHKAGIVAGVDMQIAKTAQVETRNSDRETPCRVFEQTDLVRPRAPSHINHVQAASHSRNRSRCGPHLAPVESETAAIYVERGQDLLHATKQAQNDLHWER